MKSSKSTDHEATSATAGPGFRSGAVARLARMPVATLRIWEQRYQAVKPATTPSGHRLYSPADVQRVLLLRQLTEQGHAISALAALDSEQLQEVVQQIAQAHDGQTGEAGRQPGRPRPILRLAVAGPALAARLQRPAVARHLTRAGQRVAVHESLADVASAGTSADLLLWHAPGLQPQALPELRAAQQACGAARVAVVYRFAGAAATLALTEAGMAALREPADDAVLGVWLASIEAGLLDQAAGAADTPVAETPSAIPVPAQVPPRRYDDAALTAIAGISPTLACECPRHVAELLMQLSSFEAYSAGCINRDPADAQLHAYLQQVAGSARALFEEAFERLVRHEGLT